MSLLIFSIRYSVIIKHIYLTVCITVFPFIKSCKGSVSHIDINRTGPVKCCLEVWFCYSSEDETDAELPD